MRLPWGWRWLLGLGLLGVSLVVKHILFLLPVWLAIKEKGYFRKAAAVSVPYGIFGFSFLPYASEGAAGILHHVFLYRSFANAPFWLGVMPRIIVSHLPVFGLFVITMLILGLVFRKRGPLETTFLYLVCLVVFSSAIANQYLAIPVAAMAVNWNVMYLAYTGAVTIYLTAAAAGLHVWMLERWLGGHGNTSIISYGDSVALLFLGLMVQITSQRRRAQLAQVMRDSFRWLRREVGQQIRDLRLD